MHETEQFLQYLYGKITDGYTEIRLIQEGTGLIQKRWRAMPLGEINPDGLNQLRQLNKAGWHVYHRIGISADKASTKQAIVQLPALWFDYDLKPGEMLRDVIRHHICELPLVPDMLIASGNGLHGYYLLTEPIQVTGDNRNRIERCMKGIASAVGGDHTFDITRILRLPGFYNVKAKYGAEPPLCSVFDFTSSAMWDFERIFEAFYTFMPRDVPAPARTIELPQADTMPRWIADYLASGAGQGNRNRRAYAAARGLLDNGYSVSETERLITARALADGLKQGEIDTILRSAEKSPRGLPDMDAYMRLRMSAGDQS